MQSGCDLSPARARGNLGRHLGRRASTQCASARRAGCPPRRCGSSPSTGRRRQAPFRAPRKAPHLMRGAIRRPQVGGGGAIRRHQVRAPPTVPHSEGSYGVRPTRRCSACGAYCQGRRTRMHWHGRGGSVGARSPTPPGTPGSRRDEASRLLAMRDAISTKHRACMQ